MKKLLFLFCLLLSVVGYSQDGTLDTTFNPNDVGNGDHYGVNRPVTYTKTQPDGKTIICGEFNYYNGVSRYYIARLNSNGKLDLGFSAGSLSSPFSNISSIDFQPDGKIIVASNAGNGRLARLNSNGSTDSSFNNGVSNGLVYTAAVQTDGKIIIGGGFSAYNGVARNCIARLNADGTLDTTFNVGNGAMFGYVTSSGAEATSIKNIQIQPDGKIIIAGNFTVYNGVVKKQIARLNTDGSLDLSFDSSSGFTYGNGNAGVKFNSICFQNDGKIIVGGRFNTYNGNTVNSLVRLNTDGSIDTSFATGTGFMTDWESNGFSGITLAEIKSVGIQQSGRIIVGGDFTKYNNTNKYKFAALNSDGSLDTTFNSGIGFNRTYNITPPLIELVYNINLLPDDKMIVGTSFRKYNQYITGCITRLDSNGNYDASFNSSIGPNSSVFCSDTQPDGKIIIGGDFTSYSGNGKVGFTRLNADGSIDPTFNNGNGISGNKCFVSNVIHQSDGKIIVAGSFNSYNGSAVNGIFRINSNGSLDSSFNVSQIGFVMQTILQPDGRILLISSENPSPEYNSPYFIKRLLPDGSIDSSFTSTIVLVRQFFGDLNQKMALQSDGKILFHNYNSNQSLLKRLNPDGSLDSSFTNPIFYSSGYEPINTISLQSDGKIIIGGYFQSINNIGVARLSRLNTDGSIDFSFLINNQDFQDINAIQTTEIQPNGKILVGCFAYAYPTNNNRLMRLNTDGSKDITFNTSGTGPNTINHEEFNEAYNIRINQIATQSDGSVLIGGLFNNYNGIGRSNIAKIYNQSSLNITRFETENKITVFPNPVKDILFINTSNGTLQKVWVYNSLGQLISEDTKSSINVSTFSNGTYFVKLMVDEKQYFSKFIKN